MTFVKHSGGDDSDDDIGDDDIDVAADSITPVAALAKALGSRIYNVRIYSESANLQGDYSRALYRQLIEELGFTATYHELDDDSIFLHFKKGGTKVHLVVHATIC
ncbi:MAG: hypothetical protein LBF67_03055 [Prevotellaceae bacterium]|nr:hypothetical protein [Prevotellaceae bacterium]